MEDPPRVTIIDPRSPDRPLSVWAIGPADVLAGGSAAEPWGSTRRQRLTGRLLVVLVLLVTSGWVATDHVRSDHAADRAAAAALQLWAGAAEDWEPGWVRLVLLNDGPAAVQVLAAELDGAGYGAHTRPTTVAVDGVTTLSFVDAAPCGEHLLNRPVEQLTVTVRTERGTVVRRVVMLGPQAFREVNGPARQRCGYLAMEDALRFELLPVRETADGVVLHALVANTSILPLTLNRLLPGSGIELETNTSLPLELAPRPSPGAADQLVGIGIRLTLRDCGFRARTPFDRGLRPPAQVLRAWLVRASSIREIALPLHLTMPDGLPGESVLPALRRSCMTRALS